MALITLTTDFGIDDPYVGLVKGVMLSIAPQASVIDITHRIAARDVMAGALMLESLVGHMHPGTIHVGIIDPGVGSQRKAVAIQTKGGLYFVGPDNGLFSAALRLDPMLRAVELDNPKYHHQPVSATFHGRDVFAPAAAHLACGIELYELGTPVHKLVEMDLPQPVPIPTGLQLHVVRIDHYGNLITDLTRRQFEHWLRDEPAENVQISVGGMSIRGIHQTFSDVAVGQTVAYFGSAGRLEIAIRNADAAKSYLARFGTVVHLTRLSLTGA